MLAAFVTYSPLFWRPSHKHWCDFIFLHEVFLLKKHLRDSHRVPCVPPCVLGGFAEEFLLLVPWTSCFWQSKTGNLISFQKSFQRWLLLPAVQCWTWEGLWLPCHAGPWLGLWAVLFCAVYPRVGTRGVKCLWDPGRLLKIMLNCCLFLVSGDLEEWAG